MVDCVLCGLPASNDGKVGDDACHFKCYERSNQDILMHAKRQNARIAELETKLDKVGGLLDEWRGRENDMYPSDFSDELTEALK